MLSDQEQRSWNEIERMWTRDSRGSDGLRALAVGAVGIAIMFALIGAPWAGLVLVAVPALAWSLSRYWGASATPGRQPSCPWTAGSRTTRRPSSARSASPEADREVR